MTAFQEIYVLNKRLKLAHLPNGFRTAMDSVLLAASCPAKAGEHILDIGAGVGGVGLCVLARIKGVNLTGVEIQGAQVELAQRNAVTNGFEDQCEFIEADIRVFLRDAHKDNARSEPARLSDSKSDSKYDHIICNPPYLEAGTHVRSPHIEKATAMGHEDEALDIKNWIDTAHYCLKSKGSFTLIHRSDHLDEIMKAFGKRFGAIEVFPLWPKAGVASKRVLIRAYKDRKSPMTLHYGLILHNEEGQYTVEADEILRDAKLLF